MSNRKLSARAHFILRTSREFTKRGKKASSKAFHLRTNNDSSEKTASIAGSCIATTRFWTSRGKSFDGIRLVLTSTIANKLKTECEVKMLRCAKRSNAPQCSRKLLVLPSH